MKCLETVQDTPTKTTFFCLLYSSAGSPYSSKDLAGFTTVQGICATFHQMLSKIPRTNHHQKLQKWDSAWGFLEGSWVCPPPSSVGETPGFLPHVFRDHGLFLLLKRACKTWRWGGIKTCPDVGFNLPAIICSTVDFPCRQKMMWTVTKLEQAQKGDAWPSKSYKFPPQDNGNVKHHSLKDKGQKNFQNSPSLALPTSKLHWISSNWHSDLTCLFDLTYLTCQNTLRRYVCIMYKCTVHHVFLLHNCELKCMSSCWQWQ